MVPPPANFVTEKKQNINPESDEKLNWNMPYMCLEQNSYLGKKVANEVACRVAVIKYS